jgi:hypothetical protein
VRVSNIYVQRYTGHESARGHITGHDAAFVFYR